jgi:hypothetical protein
VLTPIVPLGPEPANSLRDAALAYHGRGWSVIPVRGKRPASLWRPFQERAADRATLTRMFARPGITGVAVVTGAVSGGLAVRDFDRADAYRVWADAHPADAARLPTVATARGFHVYGRRDVEEFRTLADGELRADSRHYVLLPPSRHPSGAAYAWTVPLPEGELPILPWSVAETQQTQADSAHTLHVSDSGRILSAIAETLPTGPGQRNRRLFDLARRLKAIAPDTTPESLEGIVRDWHARALPIIRTKDWPTSWLEFREAWANVKRPAGATMADILAAAAAVTPAIADSIERLKALCRALQEHHGSCRPWPLSCRLAGSTVGISHDTAARILRLLRKEGFIELTTPAGREGSGRAAEYRLAHRRKGQ